MRKNAVEIESEFSSSSKGDQNSPVYLLEELADDQYIPMNRFLESGNDENIKIQHTFFENASIPKNDDLSGG